MPSHYLAPTRGGYFCKCLLGDHAAIGVFSKAILDLSLITKLAIYLFILDRKTPEKSLYSTALKSFNPTKKARGVDRPHAVNDKS